MEKNKKANECLNELIGVLKESISLTKAANSAMGEFQLLDREVGLSPVGRQILAPFNEKILLDVRVNELLPELIFNLGIHFDEEALPKYALECLLRYKETEDIDEVKKAFWSISAYNDFKSKVIL